MGTWTPGPAPTDGPDQFVGDETGEAASGLGGDDALSGNGGDDALDGGDGADALDGGDGADTAEYRSSGSSVSVNLLTGAAAGGHAAGDALSGIENLTGSAFADALIGDAGANVLSGLAGADTLQGGDGDDVLYGYSAGAAGAIATTLIASGMAAPAAAAATTADPGFIYILEKASGIVWRVNDDTGARTQFLDIPEEEFVDTGEQGALGLAFHPQYATNGRFFLFLTDAEGDLQIREYHRSADPLLAEPGFTLVLEIPHPTFANHNGGWLGFSPVDNYLYISTGDGGGANDPQYNSQNIDKLLGKVLRIDVDADDFPEDANRNYAIPPDNPFVGAAGADEVWLYGLRNPWRPAFDPRNGDLYIADVGQNRLEEVDYAAAGVGGINFGWRIMEGTLANVAGPPGAPLAGDPSLQLPVYEYGRTFGISITGGEVYVGPAANFVGQYLFSDFGSGRLWSLRMQDGVLVDAAERTSQLSAPILNPSDFVTGTDGHVYVLSFRGTLTRLDPGPGAEDVGDTLFGGAGNDRLEGGAGGDMLNGEAGRDSVNGGAGNDAITYNMGDGADATDGGADTDTLTILGTAAAEQLDVLYNGSVITSVEGGAVSNIETVNVDLSGGSDRLSYFGSTVAIVANLATGTAPGVASLAGVENLTGGNLDDNLTGDAGVNNLNGGATGNDTLTGTGNDTMVGGQGNDTYNAVLGDIIAEGAGAGSGVDSVFTASASFTLANNVENLTYTGAGNFTGTGNGSANVITSGGGADTLNGMTGADTINAGAGNDLVNYTMGGGADTVDGGADSDTLAIGGTGAGEQLDVLWNGSSITSVEGGAVSNVETVNVNLGGGVDRLSYFGSTVAVSINLATGVATGVGALLNVEDATGGNADDVLVGNAGVNNLNGGATGNDTLTGTGNDTLVGGLGNDTYFAVNGDTISEGGAVGSGTDSVFTASASFTLANNVENLTFTGIGGFTGTGNNSANVITGGAAIDTLNGAAGNDTLNGGTGADIINGGAGNDTINYVMGGGADAVDGGANTDTLNITGGAGNDQLDVLFNGGAISSVEGGAVSNVEVFNADLGGGTNTLSYFGSTAAVTVNLATSTATGFASLANVANATGGNGNDTLVGNAGVNNLNGGANGNDTLTGTGNDTLVGGLGNDTYFAVSGDTISEGGAVGSGTDSVFTASASFTLANNVENLTYTGAGNFTGIGNGSANVMTGGVGNDTFTGGLGADTYVMVPGFGDDVVTDFDANAAGGQDLIDVSDLGITAANFAARVSIAVVAGNTVITIDGSDSITLNGVDGVGANSITTADFLLGP